MAEPPRSWAELVENLPPDKIEQCREHIWLYNVLGERILELPSGDRLMLRYGDTDWVHRPEPGQRIRVDTFRAGGLIDSGLISEGPEWPLLWRSRQEWLVERAKGEGK